MTKMVPAAADAVFRKGERVMDDVVVTEFAALKFRVGDNPSVKLSVDRDAFCEAKSALCNFEINWSDPDECLRDVLRKLFGVDEIVFREPK